MTIRQCAMLVGGLGTRLGQLTRDTPKPMALVAGRPFLDHLLAKAARHGFTQVLLLAGYKAEALETWLRQSGAAERFGLSIGLSIEPEPLGTGGALVHARAALDDAFLLVNGDTWFDFDWRQLAMSEHAPITMALRQIAPADRYETVALDGRRITRFLPRSSARASGLINGGVYRLRKSSLPASSGPLSLETDVLPRAAADGTLAGQVFEGAFIDIGLPASLAAAQAILAD